MRMEADNKYYAHSANDKNKKHLLSEHLKKTAEFTEYFACNDNYKAIFRIAGLIHDLGKYQPAFQKYLEDGGERGSVPHSSWGAGYARLQRMIETSIVVDGHHKGLPNNSSWKSDTEPFFRGEVNGFENIVAACLKETGIKQADIGMLDSLKFTDIFQREIFTRYLFSALTDSDWLSTEEHFAETKYNLRYQKIIPLDILIEKLDKEFSNKQTGGEINRLRNDCRYQALKKANMGCGFYSLALPTGMGKTLTSMAWALQHAKNNNLKRIIIVLPYINIIDQTAQVFKNIFGEEWVLEHHSNYNENALQNHNNEEYSSLDSERKKLACENWDYPIIVTTTVQFFESLFSNRTSRCRKIHNIAESVVIFDEVQTLPKEVILPTIEILKNVQAIMKTSFLFCTATQPAFEKRQGFNGIEAICPLIENTSLLYEKTKRVRYNLLNGLHLIDKKELLDNVTRVNGSTLVIFNTKKTVLEFYDCVKDLRHWDTIYHLSTAMCPAHRKEVIQNISLDLRTGRKILVISTQLIEAGVDFDFPFVFRAMAPLEAVIQAAGRCNREGKLGEMGGEVYLFTLQDSGMPDKTYAACASYAGELIEQNPNQLYKHDIFKGYYTNILQLFIDPDKFNINEARKHFEFETVNDAYYIIKNNTEGLFIYTYSDESYKLFKALEFKEFLSREDYRRMQPYIVQVYQDFVTKNGQLCNKMPQGFYLWNGNYSSKTGISLATLEADESIV